MRPNFQNLALVFLSVVATILPAWASELTDFKIQDLAKKIKLTFEFSEVAAYSTVADFNSNILVLNYEGLELSNKQKAKDYRLEGDKDFDVLRFVRFLDTGEQAEIRIYLGWEVTPADAQVIAFDDRIEVDILKPLYLVAPDEIPAPDDDGDVGDGGWFIERDPQHGETGGTESETEVPETDTIESSTDSTGTDESSGLHPGSLRQPDYPELDGADGTGEDNPETATPLDGESDQVDEEVDISGGGSTGSDDSGLASDFRPARDFTSTPSYKKFDLDEVEVNQLEFRGVPFNEVLLDLVAGTGFNVVVGEGIDNKELTLNFTKKKMTLKSALYILCTAYDLEYTVEDDAIIIRAKN